MVQLAAMIASQAVSEYRVMLGAALTVGVTPIEAKEVVYQAVPYVLDRIDEIVPPGVTLNPVDNGWVNPWLHPALRRR